MQKIMITGGLLSIAIGLSACGGGTTPAANAAKSNNNSNAAASNSNANAAKKDDKAKPALTSAKKPEGEKAKAAKKVPVPSNWIYVYDSEKEYGFYMPEGSTGGYETHEGVNTFVGSTPAPSEIGVVVIAFKDKKMTKEDLLDVAENFLKEMGSTVTAGELKGESEDYYICEATATSQDGKKNKLKILVGTDVTDNYVMIVGTEESKFAANEAIIDNIWGSFEMWSGGASGNS